MPAPAKPAAETEAPGSLWTRDFVTVVVTQMAFGYAGSTFLLLPKYLATRFHASASQIGHASAVQALAAVLAMPWIGGFLDRVGRKPLITLGCMLSAVYAFAWVFVGRFDLWVDVLQAIGGIAAMFAFNAAGALVADQAPPARLGQAIGVFGASNMAMSAIAPAIGELLSLRYGWQAAFALAGGLALLALGLSRRIRDGFVPSARAPGGFEGVTALAAMLVLARQLAPETVAMTTCGAAYAAVATYYQPFVLAQGAKEVASFFVGFTFAAVGVRLFFGSLADRMGRSRVALASFVLYACSVFAMSWLTPARLLPFGFVFGCAHGVFYPACSAMFVERARSEERGRAMTLVMGSFRLGNIASVLALGWVAEHAGYALVFVLASLISWIGVAALYRLSTRGSLEAVRF